MQFWDAEQGLAKAFDEIDALASACRFRNCGHDSEPGCAVKTGVETGAVTVERLESWRKLKHELKAHAIPALRTKAACLRRCEDGPWLVVYPDGIWYSQVTPERFDRIRREHLEGGVPVAEWVRAVNALGP